MRLQKLRGELIDRARAVAMVFRLARQERDAWAGWPARSVDMPTGSHPNLWPRAGMLDWCGLELHLQFARRLW